MRMNKLKGLKYKCIESITPPANGQQALLQNKVKAEENFVILEILSLFRRL